jgi:catechol 2,3-dioxygenase-like lactoylglutathione lyase family enzyme
MSVATCGVHRRNEPPDIASLRATLADEVDQCADQLVRQGVNLLSPPTDQAFGHRTPFFRDPDGNLLEVFADISAQGG